MATVKTVHVLAFITTQPGQRDKALAIFRQNVPNVLAEQGCVAYQATVDAAEAGPAQAPLGPDSFVVVEQWASLAAFQAHVAAPHMKTYGAAVKDLVAKRAIHVLSAA